MHFIRIVFFVYTVLLCLEMSHGRLMQPVYRVQYHLADNTSPDHLIGSIFGDTHPPKSINRAVLSTDTLFRLTVNGDLYTRTTLDRDQICHSIDCCELDFCHISLEAYLFDSSPNPSTVHIDLFVTDENDNPPVFPQSRTNKTNAVDKCSWNLSVPESASIGSRYTLPFATDQDSSRFGVSKYKLHMTNSDGHFLSPIASPFSLVLPSKLSGNHAPELRLDRSLDREVKAQYDLILVAEDAGIPALSSELPVCIIIRDVNDNAPIFEQTNLTNGISISIQENTTVGTVIAQFVAIDADEGINAVILYTIDWTGSLANWNQSIVDQVRAKYSLHPDTGQMRVSQPLDYENEFERRLVLTIVATDQGSPNLSASMSVTVSLIDVNDNDPKIEIIDNELEDDEYAIGNNSVPILLEENNAKSKLLKLIAVTDADSVSTDRVHCHLSEQYQEAFRLTAYSPTMYGLSNLRAFDYEQETSQTGHIAVRVECVDDASPKRTSLRWVQIRLKDVNDNWPQFDRSNYHMEVMEDVEVGHRIGQIRATDADSAQSGKVSYELTSDNVSNMQYVQIDSDSGVIFTLAKLDREKVASLDFRVTAKDGGDYTGNSDTDNVKTNTTSLTVTVLDVNDNAPVYLGPGEIHVIENIPVGVEVHILNFIDYDHGTNGSVRLTLLEDTRDAALFRHPTPFTIVDNSRLLTIAQIDREELANYVLRIFASDEGIPIRMSSTVSLTIHIDDVNDNQPELVYPKNQSLLFGNFAASDWANTLATIPVDTPPGTLVSVIHGKDADYGENGTVSYFLTALKISKSPDEEAINDGFEYFQLDPKNGHVITRWGDRKSADPVEKNNTIRRVLQSSRVQTPQPGLYIIRVELCDEGVPRMCTPTVFYVNISEAIGTMFGFSILNGMTLSNTVMLGLIMVCSLALIVSLVAAIVWVRYRKDDHHRENEAGIGTNGGYFGPTVICQDSDRNGYYYPGYFPAIRAGQEYDQHSIVPEKDGMLHLTMTDSCVEGPPVLCQYDGTMRPLCVSSTHLTTCEISPSVGVITDPSQWFSALPASDFEQICSTPVNSLWIKNGTDHFTQKCITFGQGQGDLENRCQTTTNSAGESDSGVDSGTGVAGAILGPLYAASSHYDTCNNMDHCFTCSNNPQPQQTAIHSSLCRKSYVAENSNPLVMIKSSSNSTVPRQTSTRHCPITIS